MPPIENRLDEGWSEQGESQNAADVGLVDLVGCGKLCNRSIYPVFKHAPPAVCASNRFHIALSTRARWGTHVLVPSGVSMTLRPPRLRIRSGMSTTRVSPCSLRSALVMLPSAHSPDWDAHAILRPASSALPCAAGRSHGPSGPRPAPRGAER